MQKQSDRTSPVAREPFNRPPRILISPPQGDIEIPEPPEKEAIPPLTGMPQLVMAAMMITILLTVYIGINHAPAQQIAVLIPMVMMSVMSPLSNIMMGTKKRKEVLRANRISLKAYRKALVQLRTQLEQHAVEQRRVALLANPTPASLAARIKERARLWERRPDDPDFLAVRVGTSFVPFSMNMIVPAVNKSNPAREEVRALTRDFAAIEDVPCTISLYKIKSLGITGVRQEVAALMRAMLCQIAIAHSPEDVRILGIFPFSQQHDWSWLNDLPHTDVLKGWSLPRMTAIGEDDANQMLSFLLEELSLRASRQAEIAASDTPVASSESVALPHIIVIVHDYVEVRKHPALTNAFKLGEQLGVSIIYMVAQEQSIPGECRGVARLAEDGRLYYAAIGVLGGTLQDVKSDLMDLVVAQTIALALGNIQVKDASSSDDDLPTNVRFLDLVELPYADQLKAEKWWQQPRYGMLRVPIGMGLKGPIWLDLSENMHGPHGIIAGTTGSGKSELLQSIIVGLAITHHPFLVNFVLVDFKGGAAFKPFEKIPHTVGMVTDLSGKLTERALVSLKSELRRREHVLSQVDAKKIAEYIALREQNPTMEPLPHLFIIIDEFAELAKEHPIFMEGLVSVVQKGRSLGVHLILATQKPTGSVNANIWSNLKFRICLRVASLQDSRDMLGRSEAALLPATIPGRAYFQIGSEVFDVFQSARISLPARVLNESMDAKTTQDATDMQVLMGMLEPYQETLGLELFKPWPAPLPHAISLEEVQKQCRLSVSAPHKESEYPLCGWLNCPVGLIDLPMEQRQVPWFIDMPRMGGHILVAGASGSGKSVFLRTLIMSLAQTHTPAQLHFYLVDYGGQALRVFEKLPHVGGVFNESDDDYIRRLLHKLNGIIDERKQFFMANQIDDFQSYQRRRSEKSPLAALAAVVLVIDRFIDFKQVYDKEMELILSIVRYGRTYGVYLVLSADRPVAVPMQIVSQIEIRIGLRMVEVNDSLIFLGKNEAAYIDPATAGRGYRRGRSLEEVHIALPFHSEDDDEQAQFLDEWVTEMVQTMKIEKSLKALPIRLLPEYVRAEYFLMEAISSTSMQQKTEGVLQPPSELAIRLGIEDFSLSSISVELNKDTPHMFVVGGPGSGRTTVLQTLLLMMSNPIYGDTKVALVDFRRTSRPLRRLPNMWMYADTEERLLKMVVALKEELRVRVTRMQEILEAMKEADDDVISNLLLMDPIVLVVDDYDQLGSLSKNPLLDLREFLLQARDLGLYIIVTGTPSDITRSDVLLQQIRACRLGVILGADPNEPQILGVRMRDLPPGRGYLVRRNQRRLVQVAHLAPALMPSWIARLARNYSNHDQEELKKAEEAIKNSEKIKGIDVEKPLKL
jgi:DNA segregation ATPase FtsK/SpoIIIE, S-DNA-T family